MLVSNVHKAEFLFVLCPAIIHVCTGVSESGTCAGHKEAECSAAWPDPTEAEAFLQTVPMRGGTEVSMGTIFKPSSMVTLPSLDKRSVPNQLLHSKTTIISGGAQAQENTGFTGVKEAKTVLKESSSDNDDSEDDYEYDNEEDDNDDNDDDDNEDEAEEAEEETEEGKENSNSNSVRNENDNEISNKNSEDERKQKDLGDLENLIGSNNDNAVNDPHEPPSTDETKRTKTSSESHSDDSIEDRLKEELEKEAKLAKELKDEKRKEKALITELERKLENEQQNEKKLEKELENEKRKEVELEKMLEKEDRELEEEKKKEKVLEEKVKELEEELHKKKKKKHHKKKHHKKKHGDHSIPDDEPHEDAQPHVMGEPIEMSGKTTEFAVPSTVKLRNLAEEILAAAKHDELENATDAKAVHEAEDVLNHLQDGKTPTPAEFEEAEMAASEEHFSELMTAETASQNEQMLTAGNEAEVMGKDSYEDVGSNGTLEAYEGDMIPADKEQLLLFQRISDRRKANKSQTEAAGIRWSKGIVNYCFASDVPEDVKHLFTASAHQYMRALPCLQFNDVGHRSGSSMDPASKQLCGKSPAIFVTSHPYRGCYSYVGMVPQFRSQQLQMHPVGCISIGTMTHEIGHALGMAHEQARPDRDKYVSINVGNVKHGMMRNFEIIHRADVSLDYDYCSIMHYDAYAFAKDRSKPTILSDVTTEMGNRAGLSSYDVKQLEHMYKPLVPHCRGSQLAGLGCIDKLWRGKKVCPKVQKCTQGIIKTKACCACGGGFKVQCYKGQTCPQAEPLTPPPGSNCLVSKTHFFPGYECIFTNVCDFPVKWQCPSHDCKHVTGAGGYWMQSCNGITQTEVCKPGVCKVRRM